MDISTLASQALEILQMGGALVVGGALQSMGEDAHQKVKVLAQSFRSRWSKDTDALAALEAFQEPVSSQSSSATALSPERRAFLLALIAQTLREDDELRAQVESLVSSSPQLRVTQTVEEGHNLVGVEAEEFSSGQVEVHQHVQKAESVTGAKIGRIG